MKKLKPLFGFECESNERGLVSIDVDCEFPQQKNNCLLLYNRLEEIKIIDSGIVFPLKLKHFLITINPDKFTIMKYFRIDGIKKIVEENISKLIGKTTFVKPEVQYNKKAKYPNLHIHFYQISEEEGMEIMDDIEDMIQSCFIEYENTKQFTKKRLSDLEKYVNPLELQVMSFFPMELVKFDIDCQEILPFPQQQRMLKSVELPF